MIKHLKTSIHHVEKNAEEQSHRIISDAAKAESVELKNSDGKRAKLQQEILQLKQSLQSNLTTHRENELALRKVGYFCWSLVVYKAVDISASCLMMIGLTSVYYPAFGNFLCFLAQQIYSSIYLGQV